MNSFATINISENFEGATAFVDKDWATRDQLTSTTSAQHDSVQGTAIRDYAVEGTMGNKPAVTSAGTIVTERHFLGAKSFKLTTGQSISPQKGSIHNDLRCNRVRQFAVSFSTESLASLAPGTQVGHYKAEWTIVSGTVPTSVTADVADARFQLNFVTSTIPDAIDIMCSNTATKVGTFYAGVGGWGLVSIISNPLVTAATPDAPTVFVAYRSWTPGPTGMILGDLVGPKNGDTATSAAGGAITLAPGMYVYLNSAAGGTYVPRAAVGTSVGAGITDGTWGNDNVAATTGNLWNSCEIRWELVAEGGGTMYVDNVYDDYLFHDINGGRWGSEIEAAQRMLDFNAVSNEPGRAAAAKSWELY